MTNKPFAAAAEQNREDILPIIKKTFKHANCVLEIGSGTGQHAAYFAKHLPHLTWQASDVSSMLDGIQLWIDEANLPNLPKPISLDVNKEWPKKKYDAAYAANIAHIMHWQDLETLFKGLSDTLSRGGIFCLYGPFNIDSDYTSESNQRFDHWLKQKDPESGLRDRGELNNIALKNGLHPDSCWDMPANNKILSWKK